MADLNIYAFAERLMKMDDATWARHANPWSVYSRIAGGSLVFFALWSPYWLGFLGVVPIALAFGWPWLNPRLFAPPRGTATWATRAVLGERAFLDRARVPIPDHHRRVAHLTTAVTLGFILVAGMGFWRAEFWLAVTAWHASVLAKVWFCDRMVWLWVDMRDATGRYRAWDRAEWG